MKIANKKSKENENTLNFQDEAYKPTLKIKGRETSGCLYRPRRVIMCFSQTKLIIIVQFYQVEINVFLDPISLTIPVHRFLEIPVGFPEIWLKLTNPTISRRETCLWVSFPLFPAGKLAFTSEPGFSRKIS